MKKIITVMTMTVAIATMVVDVETEEEREVREALEQDTETFKAAIKEYKSSPELRKYCLFMEVLVDYGLDCDRVGEILTAYPELKEEFEEAWQMD